MKKEQAHIILYTLWQCGYLDKNFTEPHSEYDWAVDLLINPRNKYSYEYREWDEDYSVQKISKIDMRKAKEISISVIFLIYIFSLLICSCKDIFYFKIFF